MGLGVAIGGAMGALTVFVVILTYPMVSDNLMELTEVKSQMNSVEESFAKTDFMIESLFAESGSDLFSVSITNTGSEKLWNYNDFIFLVEYDANILGTSTRITERLVYNETASFADPVIQQIARPDSDDAVGTWTATPLFEKLDEMNPNDSDFVSDTPVANSDTGLQDPTNTGDDHNQWTDPTNAFVSDNNWATEGTNGNQQDWYDFSLSVPIGATIDGIQVNVEGSETGLGTSGVDIEISWDGGTSYTSTGKGTTWNGVSDVISSFGDDTDTWGRAWLDSEFSDSNFRVRLEKTGGVLSTVRVDHIQTIVYYTINGVTSTAEVGLSSITDPLTNKGHVIRLRENGGIDRTVTISLVEGGSTTIASDSFSSTNSYTTREIHLSNTQADSITDYDNLSIRWSFIDSGGDGTANVSWAEFEIQGIPDFDGDSQQWGVNGISEDHLDPGIINHGESLEFGGKLQYDVFANGFFKVSITTDNGRTEFSSIAVS